MFRLFSLLFLGLLASSCTTPPKVAAGNGPLILISIDAFRWDYLQKYDVPTLRLLAAAGTHARRLIPSFPSRTFPNHYTLVTGLRPEHHGIVNNYFHDPALKADFAKPNNETYWWNGGEPVWITAEKQGVRSACYFWPGSEVELQGRHPAFSKPYDRKFRPTQRVAGLLEWLALPEIERPKFYTLYLDAVDVASHTYGPDSSETAAAAHEVDGALAQLLDGLAKLGLRDTANIVVVSDHGMSETSPDRVVFFDDLMDMSLVTVEANGPHGGVRPKPGVDTAALVASIRTKAPPQVHVYRREEVPERLHYRANDRIPPIVFVLEDHWCIEQKTGWPVLQARFDRGNHGWDPATPNMGALFIASGPAFRRGVELPDVENIHVYELVCAVLGLTPAPNDGDNRLARAALAR
jgi:predicted AlkP superfamily pyrophosphatase or phosphodiesterase